jgi:hypothetical protein
MLAERCEAETAGGVVVMRCSWHALVLHARVGKAEWWMLQLQQCMFGGVWEV